MKTVKIIFIVLFIIIIIPLIVALFVPKESNSEGQVVINRSHQEVFDYIKLGKNQDNFGVWHLSDPNMKTTEEGIDGTVGFKYSWESDKLGKGAQVITRIVEGERMESDMFFYDFGDTPNKSYFILENQGVNKTLVRWGISWETPYPRNLMSLFYNMDKDFEKGLQTLKEILESNELQSVELSLNDKTFTFNHPQE